MTIDSVDLRILRLLAKNSRATLREIAKEVSLSLPGARRRIKKLERIGVIKRYTVLADPKQLGANVLVFIQVNVEAGAAGELISKLSRRSQILEIHRVTGSDAFILKARFEDMDEMNAFLKEHLSSPAVRGVTSWVVLETYKEEPFVP